LTAFVFIALYAAAAVALAGCLARAWGYARLPLHLRWELYPVPHEAAERAEHGGSYFEETDWWTRPQAYNLAGELAAMGSEILFMKALHAFNRKLWVRSYVFHFGLYLLIGTAGLVLATAIATLVAPGAMGGPLGMVLHVLYRAGGVAGAALCIAGALALLGRRLTDSDLSNYTVPGDLFNLLFFVAALGTACAGYALRGDGAPGVLAFTVALLRFDTALAVPRLWAAGVLLCALLAAYIPMTHMAHFIGKFFTYHSVRWDDAAVAKSPEIAVKLAGYLAYRPTWSAPHVAADGRRSWADVAKGNPWEGAKK
jgi:nitrate reductase gamma subunit